MTTARKATKKAPAKRKVKAKTAATKKTTVRRGKPTVVVTRKWPEAVEKELKRHFDVRLNKSDKPMSVAQLQRALRTADALLPTVTDKISDEVLSVSGKRARIIGNFGVGYNNIDIAAAKREGLAVTNTPEVLTDCTADIAMTLMLSVARRGGEGERHVRNKKWTGWRPTHMMGAKVTGKTLGLIGFGRIAQAMAHKAHHGFGMKIVFFDPYLADKKAAKAVKGVSRSSIDAVLKEADFVSLHCPSTPETRRLINATKLKKMKKSAFLINTARGDVVDEKALVKALKTGAIAGAGLDVFEAEPKVTAALLKMENAVLFPHLGSATLETREAMGFRVVDNIKAFFKGKRPKDRVA